MIGNTYVDRGIDFPERIFNTQTYSEETNERNLVVISLSNVLIFTGSSSDSSH